VDIPCESNNALEFCNDCIQMRFTTKPFKHSSLVLLMMLPGIATKIQPVSAIEIENRAFFGGENLTNQAI
jgi:hypothetical protein